MNANTGEIFENTEKHSNEEFLRGIERRCPGDPILLIPDDEVDAVRAMNTDERKMWAKKQARKERNRRKRRDKRRRKGRRP